MTLVESKYLAPFLAKHQEEVKKTYYFGKEYTEEEYEEIIRKTEMQKRIEMAEAPNENLKQAIAALYDEEIRSIKTDLRRMKEFKVQLEAERKRIEKLPRNNEQVIHNLEEWIKEETNSIFREILDNYFSDIVKVVTALCPDDDKDTKKTVDVVYKNKASKDTVKVFEGLKYNLIRQLLTLTMKVKENESPEFVKVEQTCKSKFHAYLIKIFMYVDDFITKKVKYLQGEKMSSATAVTPILESFLNDFNIAVKTELQDILNEVISNETTVEKEEAPLALASEMQPITVKKVQAIKVEEPVIEEPEEDAPASLIKTFENFLRGVPSEPMLIGELAERYNSYFGTSKTPIGLSKTKDIKGHFNVIHKKVGGKLVTYYT